MAGSGPPPNPNRRRRNADTYADVAAAVLDDGMVRGPEPDPDWSSSVRSWWETWRRAPQAATFLATDWQRLRMLAPLVARYWADPDKALLAEIRINESLMGATHVDRLKARIEVRPAATGSSGGGPPSDELARRRRRIVDAS